MAISLGLFHSLFLSHVCPRVPSWVKTFKKEKREPGDGMVVKVLDFYMVNQFDTQTQRLGNHARCMCVRSKFRKDKGLWCGQPLAGRFLTFPVTTVCLLWAHAPYGKNLKTKQNKTKKEKQGQSVSQSHKCSY